MNFISDLSLTQIVTRLFGYIIVVAVHGFAYAGLATLMGDREPAAAGRLTVNPVPHVSFPGLIAAIVFQISWMRPLHLEPRVMRWGRLGLIVVYVGSLAVLLAMVPLLTPLRVWLSTVLTGTAAVSVLGVIDASQRLGIWFVLLNALPLPALTGALLLQAIWPPVVERLEKLELPAMLIFLVILGTGLFQATFSPLQSGLVRLLMN